MAYNSNEPRAEYIASAGQTLFPFIFKIYTENNIEVHQTRDDVTTELILNIDYTVIVDGDNGGTFTLTVGAEQDDAIVLLRDLSVNRYVDYQTSGDLLATTLNADQDYQTYLIADQYERQEYNIFMKPGVPGFNGELPYPVPHAYLRWDSTGKKLENDISTPGQVWEAEAEALTSKSYAVEPEDIHANVYTSNGDGTFKANPTTDYSSLHHAAKSATWDPTYYTSLVDTIEDMLLITPIDNQGVFVTEEGRGGMFIYDSAQSGTNDGGLILDGWVRQYDGPEYAVWWDIGTADDTTEVQAAVDASTDLILPDGVTVTNLAITSPMKLSGGEITLNSIRIQTSGVEIQDIIFSTPSYDLNNRAIYCYAYDDAVDYENITVANCTFNGFFYATDIRAREYDAASGAPGNRIIKEVTIKDCVSTAPVGNNAGHFQNIGVTNVTVRDCRTYGGQNASSYNFINTNTGVHLLDNYEEGNTYAATEVENNSTNIVISNNTFEGDIWIDDSHDAIITENTAYMVQITTETYNVYNIVVSNNILTRFRTSFFNTPGFRISCHVSNNIFRSTVDNPVYLSDIYHVTFSGNVFRGSYADALLKIFPTTDNRVFLYDNQNFSSNSTVNITGNDYSPITQYDNYNIDFSFSTASRPSYTSTGFMFYDTSVGKPVYDSGLEWRDSDGNPV